MARAKTHLPPNWVDMVARCRPEHLGKLSDTREALAMIEILEELFPAEFARIRNTRFTIDKESGLHVGVQRLFTLVGERYFPLWDGAEVGEYDLGAIPFMPFIDLVGFENEPDCYGSALTVAFGLIGFSYFDGGDNTGCALLDTIRALGPAPAQTVSFDVLSERAARLRTPLRHLPLALEIVDHASPNAFLHGSCECGSCTRIPWSAENVRALVVEYREAKAGLRKVERLEKWLDADRETRIAQAVRLWNACADPAKATDSKLAEGDMDVAA